MNLLLSVIKVVTGIFGHSMALVADGIHSLSDMVTDIVVLVGVHFGTKEADPKHPYGHGRFETFATVFRGSAELPANNTGIMRGIFRFCNEYAKKRIQGGKPIIEHQNVQSMLAKILMDIEVAEQFMWRICWGVENDATFTPRFTRYGKVFSDQASLRVIGRALDILGGVGILRDYPVEKMIRDLLTFLHGDGTDSLNLLRAAQTLDDPA